MGSSPPKVIVNIEQPEYLVTPKNLAALTAKIKPSPTEKIKIKVLFH